MAIEHGPGLNRCISHQKLGGDFPALTLSFPEALVLLDSICEASVLVCRFGEVTSHSVQNVTFKKGIFWSWRCWKFWKWSWFWLGYYEHLYHSVDHFLWNKPIYALYPHWLMIHSYSTVISMYFCAESNQHAIHFFPCFKGSPQALVARGYCHLQRPDAAKLRKRAQEARENAEKLQDGNARRVEGASKSSGY